MTCMRPILAAMGAALLAACGGSGPATTAAPQQPAGAAALSADPGWTGATHPQDVIFARRELMEHADELMRPIDRLELGEYADPAVLQEHAEVIGAMLRSLPHLFPPTTNLDDPKVKPPVTLALPAIWQNFDGFYALAGAAADAAGAMAEAQGREAQRAAGANLRAACTACHEVYLRDYPPHEILPSDYEFDFESVLP